jgi:hypothetical protein
LESVADILFPFCFFYFPPVCSVCSGESVLITAAKKGDLKFCQVLVSAGADVNATYEGYHAYPCKCFLESVADIFFPFCFFYFPPVCSVCSGESALMGAACCGHLEMCQFLISAGADVNAMDEGYHAYPRKCFFKSVADILFFLCSSSVCSRESALMKAARYGHLEVCQVLISAGADVNAIDEGYHV